MFAIDHGKGEKDVDRAVFRQPQTNGLQDRFRVMFKGAEHRQLHLPLPGGMFSGDKLGIFLNVAPDIDADQKDKQAQQERDAPRPGQHIFLRQQLHQIKSQRREYKSAGDPHLAPGGVVAFLLRRGILTQHQDAAAPFAAGGDALDKTQGNQGDRRQNTDVFIGWQQTNQKGTGAH